MNITDVLVIDSQRKQGHIKTCWVPNANKIILNLKCLLLFAYHGAVLYKWGSNINPELKTTDRSTVFFYKMLIQIDLEEQIIVYSCPSRTN